MKYVFPTIMKSLELVGELSHGGEIFEFNGFAESLRTGGLLTYGFLGRGVRSEDRFLEQGQTMRVHCNFDFFLLFYKVAL